MRKKKKTTYILNTGGDEMPCTNCCVDGALIVVTVGPALLPCVATGDPLGTSPCPVPTTFWTVAAIEADAPGGDADVAPAVCTTVVPPLIPPVVPAGEPGEWAVTAGRLAAPRVLIFAADM